MIRYILAAVLFAGPAFGQSVTQPQIPPGTPGNIVSVGPGGVAGDSAYSPNTMPVTATGGTTARTLTDRAQTSLTVEDFGAKGDCATDDTAAFNAYSSYLRGLTGYSGYRQFTLGNSRCYVLSGSVNLTDLSNTMVDGHGSTLVGSVSGKAILDAVESPNLTIQNLNIISGGSPLVGIQLGRALNGLSGAQSNAVRDVFIDGAFTRAAIYNRASETSVFDNVFAQNRQNSTTAYGVILDGNAYWQIISDFASTYNPGSPTVADALYSAGTTSSSISFNENTLLSGTISSYYGPAVWMSNFRGLSFLNTYIGGFGHSGGTGPAAVLYFGTGDAPHQLTWKVHSEGNLSSDIEFDGAQSAPVLVGLDYENHIDSTAGSTLARGTGVTSATVNDLHIRIAQFVTSGLKVFDDATKWTLTGSAWVPANNWNSNATLVGLLDTGSGMQFTGTISPSAALPSSLNVSAVQSTGSVTAITVNNGSSYFSTQASLPTITIGAPSGGGAQATAAVNTVGFWSPPTVFVSGGTGFAVNDVVQFAVPGMTCSQNISMKVTSINASGSVTGLGSNATIGDCPAALATNAAAAMVAVTGSGSGLITNNTTGGFAWRVNTITVTGGGSGYASPPSVSIANGALGSPVVTLSSSLTLASGGGQVVMQGGQTQLGIAGTSGTPVLSLGAMIDNSGVRVSLGSAYTVPANTSLVRFIQTGTVAASTVTLPTALADGQPIQFVNYTGAVTALTFSPAVSGWTNGTALAVNTGLRVRWDATSAAWYREQ